LKREKRKGNKKRREEKRKAQGFPALGFPGSSFNPPDEECCISDEPYDPPSYFCDVFLMLINIFLSLFVDSSSKKEDKNEE